MKRNARKIYIDMELIDAIRVRHSVRNYTDEPVQAEIVARLRARAEQFNKEAGLHLQVVTDDPEAFTKGRAHYGKFTGVRNYIALVGPKADDLDGRLGYYGEKLVLGLTQDGIQTCWVGLTFSKNTGRVEVGKGEKFVGVICFGHGTGKGSAHRVKTREAVAEAKDAQQWFLDGVDAALLAPTAVNQQKFRFTLLPDGRVRLAKAGFGFFTGVDLGIVRCHFEIGAARPVVWA